MTKAFEQSARVLSAPTHDSVLESLDRATCLELLASVPMARIGVTVGALPVILPVMVTLAHLSPHGDPVIVIRSGVGTRLSAAAAHAVVAVEADDYDPISHTGWSVVVQGESRILESPLEQEWASALPLRPWAHPAADCFIAVPADLVTGRRLGIA